ncbi:MAG: AAA family ATPase [Candidatus Electrothrix sp. GW3-4]|uniref:AAA family ATPase n=1 Tax=Candidatus Electrothrix sp. GW3-4 TaxID=3126740 RepID=UPI0030CF69A1
MKNKILKGARPTITNDHGEEHIYVFEQDAIDAVNAALAINRPLLIRGEPGAGKSQLAKAAAAALKRTYIPFTVNHSTEAKDLLCSFDAVARLADAQIEGALCKDENERCRARERLAKANYLSPGPLWQALNWQSAGKQYAKIQSCRQQAGVGEKAEDPCGLSENPMAHYLNADKAESNGAVVLIDEIDKADSSVPNGLLEVLGANRFHPEGMDRPVEAEGIPPLIIITTNEERILPDAFIRRCLSVTLGLPENRAEQVAYLVKHGAPNFPELENDKMERDKNVLQAAAEMILNDRALAQEKNLHPLPGQAEYFDLLRGMDKLKKERSPEEFVELLTTLSRFTSKKHPDFPRDSLAEAP